MTKKTLVLSTIILLSLVFIACKKEEPKSVTTPVVLRDSLAPTIVIIGDNPYQIELGSTWSDPGATANDDKDGNITSRIIVTGTINTNIVDEYSIVYKATDNAGNIGSATRKVRVKANKLAATYRVVETFSDNTTYEYMQTVAQSSSEWNKLIATNFGDYGNSASVVFTAGPSGLTAPNITFTSSQQPFSLTNISGTYEKAGNNFNIKTVRYTLSDGGTPTVINQTYVRQ
jgi:hypothetical protein